MRRNEKNVFQELQGTLDEIISQLKKLIREGNTRRLIIRNKEGKVLFQSHLTIGVAGTAFAIAIAPIISAVTMFLMFVNDVSVIVEHEEDTEEDEYEVHADIIEVTDDEEEESETASKDKTAGEQNENDGKKNKEETEKTVGKE